MTIVNGKKHFALLSGLVTALALPGCGMFESNFWQPNREFSAYRVEPPKAVPPIPVEGDDMSTPVIMHSGAPDLFAEKLGSDQARLDRLEQEVQMLYERFHLKIPPMDTIAALENAVQGLVLNPPKSVDASAPIGRPVRLMPSTQAHAGSAHMAAPRVAPKSEPVMSPSAGGIQNIRIAQHEDKTRVVFDSLSKVSYDLDYDQGEGIILISASDSLAGDFSSRASKSAHIKTLSSVSQNGKTNVILTLNGEADVSQGTTLLPNKDSRHYRYFFSIVK